MAHDFASDPHGGDDEPFDGNQNGNQCEHDDHIMSYGKTPTIWSDCSVRDFVKHYNDIKNRGLDWCMPEGKYEFHSTSNEKESFLPNLQITEHIFLFYSSTRQQFD